VERGSRDTDQSLWGHPYPHRRKNWMTVLIVESGPGVERLLRDTLRDHGVEVTVAGSVAVASVLLGRSAFDVAVVDMDLPDGSGLEMLDQIRGVVSSTHIIVTTASPSADERAEAAQLGADDYVIKPFLVRELTTQILAVGRRGDPHRDQLLRAGALTIELKARQARIDDRLLELTAKEFDLLAYLMARPGHVFSRDQLLRAVWHSTAEWQQPATVTEHIRRLRTKLESDPCQPHLLTTVRGAGYRFDARGEPSDGPGTGTTFAPGTIIHVAGRIVRADRAAAVMLGRDDPCALVGCQISELASPASRPAARERMALQQLGSRRRTQLLDLDRVDGTQISVEVASKEYDWQGDRAQQVTLTHRPDVSARLRHLVTGVLSEVTDAVIITDLHFHVRSWNQAAERLYGWRQHEVLGRHILDVIQSVSDDADLAEVWAALERTSRWKANEEQVTRDGSMIRVLVSTTLVRDESSEPVAIVSVNRPSPVAIGHRCSGLTDGDDELRAGLANEEFEVFFQPVVALDDLRVVAMEALVRWNHPERGLLAPAAFIETAEQCGSIVELGHFVLEQACIQAAEWRRAGLDIELAVNLSARQLSDPELFDRVSSVLAFTDLDPSKLWFEVTETSLVEEVDEASAVLHRLAHLGIGIMIDDFGTGWASLTYLRNFPVHALKIDRSFVAGIGRNAHDTAIARSILSLGAELGLHVVAEGIETSAQQQALRKLGCTLAQGYLYGHPGPASSAPIHRARSIEPEGAQLIGRPNPPPTDFAREAPDARSATTSPITRLSPATDTPFARPVVRNLGGVGKQRAD
jgi:PAS domain S-box-containing protein